MPDEEKTTEQILEDLAKEHPLRPGVKFGVFDTQDMVWMGDNDGPFLFEDREVNGKMLSGSLVARINAESTDSRLGWGAGRCIALPFQEGPLHKKDEIKAHMTGLEWLEKKESGRIL